jgi:hypothetical protein
VVSPLGYWTLKDSALAFDEFPDLLGRATFWAILAGIAHETQLALPTRVLPSAVVTMAATVIAFGRTLSTAPSRMES